MTILAFQLHEPIVSSSMFTCCSYFNYGNLILFEHITLRQETWSPLFQLLVSIVQCTVPKSTKLANILRLYHPDWQLSSTWLFGFFLYKSQQFCCMSCLSQRFNSSWLDICTNSWRFTQLSPWDLGQQSLKSLDCPCVSFWCHSHLFVISSIICFSLVLRLATQVHKIRVNNTSLYLYYSVVLQKIYCCK